MLGEMNKLEPMSGSSPLVKEDRSRDNEPLPLFESGATWSWKCNRKMETQDFWFRAVFGMQFSGFLIQLEPV